MDETEIDTLLAAVTAEAERRGRLTPRPAAEKPAPDTKRQRSHAPAEDGACFDNGQAQCGARGVQGGRQAFRDCAAVWDFAVRCQKGARHRGAGPEMLALIASQINQ